jgi:hypothetical protein
MMAAKTKAELCFKEHRTDGKVILAFCDADLLSETIKFGDVDFEVSESFYGSKKAGYDEILKGVSRADIINAVGIKAVSLLTAKGIVDENCVLWMGEVPHVQVLRN